MMRWQIFFRKGVVAESAKLFRTLLIAEDSEDFSSGGKNIYFHALCDIIWYFRTFFHFIFISMLLGKMLPFVKIISSLSKCKNAIFQSSIIIQVITLNKIRLLGISWLIYWLSNGIQYSCFQGFLTIKSISLSFRFCKTSKHKKALLIKVNRAVIGFITSVYASRPQLFKAHFCFFSTPCIKDIHKGPSHLQKVLRVTASNDNDNERLRDFASI